MIPSLIPLAIAASPEIGPGETIFFWVVAPLVVLAALSLIFAKKPVYAAVGLVFVMIGLAALYIAQDAMFLGIVQVVVYTGAIMMLFLFVLMLIGVDAAESVLETIRGQRALTAIFSIGLLIGLGGIVAGSNLPAIAGLETPNAGTNPVGVAITVFSNYAFAMQLTGALLIVAALSAMTLTHVDRIGPKRTQRDLAEARMAGWARGEARISQLPPSGTYSQSNRATVPALGPNGQPVEGSVPHVLRVRGQEQTIGEVAPGAVAAAMAPEPVRLTRMPGMPGEAAPNYDAPASAPSLPAGEAGNEEAEER